MARPATRRDIPATRQRLLDAAESTFGGDGFDGARLADIAALAGIRRPSLLYHFDSKETLYTAVVERAFDDIGRALAGAMISAGSFEARITGLVERFADFLERRPDAGRIFLREVLDGHGPGRAIIGGQGGPLLTLVEGFLRHDAGDRIPADYPLRAALMQTVSNLLLWSAAGPLRRPLWGGDHHAWLLARPIWDLHGAGQGGN